MSTSASRKHGPDGEVVKRKVRLIAGGHRQKEGVNYTDTFASAARLPTIRTVLSLAAQRDWEIHQVDVIGAYLNSKLEEEVYMEAPPGILTHADGDVVCRLVRSLYGLKQAGRAWYKKMVHIFKQMNFALALSDTSLFIRTNDQGALIIPVSTDDMTVTGSTRKVVEDFKVELRRYLPITDGGELKWMLGFEVKRDRVVQTIGMNQKAYIEEMARKFGQVPAKTAYTPMEAGPSLEDHDLSKPRLDVPYQEACGHILWPAVVTRPDIQFAVGILARYTKDPSHAQWNAVLRVIRYLYTTRDKWLVLGGWKDELTGYADADWASQPDRHSIAGYCFFLGNGAISWSSKRQSIIALSTAEAEYIAGVHAAKEVIWLRMLLNELGVKQDKATILRCDNQSAIAL